MTPMDLKTISTPFGDLKYEAASALWFQRNASHKLEVAIGGGPAGPSKEAVQIVEQLLPIADRLVPTAQVYLNAFIKTEAFDEKGEWHLEGLELEMPPNTAPGHFGLCFSHPGDLYGYWTVVFRRLREHEQLLLKQMAMPVSFRREQR